MRWITAIETFRKRGIISMGLILKNYMKTKITLSGEVASGKVQ
jgi:hypothetical protein